MSSTTAAKKIASSEYNEALHSRFLVFTKNSGLADNRLASLLRCSPSTVSRYKKGLPLIDLSDLEDKIEKFLDHQEGRPGPPAPSGVCDTSQLDAMGGLFRYCQMKRKMGVIVAPSGTGKTVACTAYRDVHPTTILITADVVRRSVGSLLRMFSRQLEGEFHQATRDILFDSLMERLKGASRLVLVDDSHFLSWECFEVIRRLHDSCSLGVVLVGQPRLYDQMRGGNRGMLFDQILSRLAIRLDQFPVARSDVRMIADTVIPGLDKQCIDFLFKKACGQGRFRTMINVVNLALNLQELNKTPATLDLLIEADTYLVH